MATVTAAKPAEFFTDLLRAHVLDKVHSNLNSAQEEWSELLKRQGLADRALHDAQANDDVEAGERKGL